MKHVTAKDKVSPIHTDYNLATVSNEPQEFKKNTEIKNSLGCNTTAKTKRHIVFVCVLYFGYDTTHTNTMTTMPAYFLTVQSGET